MHQVVSILKLRVAQLARIIADGGWRAMLVFAIMLALIGFGVKSVTDNGALYLNAVLCGLLYMVDVVRKDTPFLLLLKKDGRILRIAEYSIVIVLANLYALLLSPLNIIYMLGSILLMALIIYLAPATVRMKMPDMPKWLVGLLPVRMYEQKYGARQLFVLFAVLWIASLLTSFFGPVLPFFIVILSCLWLEHLSYHEPIEITQSHLSVQSALGGKMLQLASTMVLLFTPQLVITFWYWGSPILFAAVLFAYWISLSTLYYAMLLRYTTDVKLFSSMSKSIRLLLFLIIAPLVPLSAYMLYKQYKTAQCNLQPLLS